MDAQKVPAHWEKWCKTGKHGIAGRKKNAVLKCLKSGQVRGYFSDLLLNPQLEHDHSLYPSIEHLNGPTEHQQAVVETRLINHMKSHLTEDEFWRVIEHLFVVGLEKGKIKPPFGKRLPKKWSPARHFKKVIASGQPKEIQLPIPVSKAA